MGRHKTYCLAVLREAIQLQKSEIRGKVSAAPHNQWPDFKPHSATLRRKSKKPPKSFRDPSKPAQKSVSGKSAPKPELTPQICFPSGAGLDLQCLAIKAGSRKNTNCLTRMISVRPETLAPLEASVGRAPLPRYQA
jgi:hypothetical protein